jgi:hypothetical protein
VLIGLATESMRRICNGPVEVTLSTHELLGMLVRGRPVDGDGVVAATIAVVRMIATVKGSRR